MGSSKKKKQEAENKKRQQEMQRQAQVEVAQERARLQEQTQRAESERQQMLSMLQQQQQTQAQARQQQEATMSQQAAERDRVMREDYARQQAYQQQQQTQQQSFLSNQQAQQVSAYEQQKASFSQAANVEGEQTRAKQLQQEQQIALQRKGLEDYGVTLSNYTKSLADFQAGSQAQLATMSAENRANLENQQKAQQQLITQLQSQYSQQEKALGQQVTEYQKLNETQAGKLSLLEGEYTRAKSEKNEAQVAATQPIIRELENQASRTKLLTHLSSLRGKGFNPEYSKKSSSNLLR